MKSVVLTITLLIGWAATPVAAVERVLPASEHEFGRFLPGCWTSYEHAHLIDGSESERTLTICFDDGGDLVVSSQGYEKSGEFDLAGTGRFWLANERLFLENSGPPSAWPFEQARAHCDALVRPDKSLELTNCRADGTDVYGGALYLQREKE